MVKSKTPAADKRPLPKFCVRTALSEAWGPKLIEESEDSRADKGQSRPRELKTAQQQMRQHVRNVAGRLGLILGRLGAILGRLGAILGRLGPKIG